MGFDQDEDRGSNSNLPSAFPNAPPSSSQGIPIGKLSLYCAAGGIAPHRVLPVTIDVGTDNKELLEDPFYLGLKEPRLKGEEYFSVVDEFMQAVKHRWPKCLVQFEDFRSEVAQPLLNNYRDTHLCFNDDIQGTGATTLAGCLGALRAAGESVDSLGEQRILIAGAGSAGIGVAQVLRQAMIEQGVEEGKAKDCFFIADEHGLLTEDRDDLNNEQRAFARSEGRGMSLQDIAEKVRLPPSHFFLVPLPSPLTPPTPPPPPTTPPPPPTRGAPA